MKYSKLHLMFVLIGGLAALILLAGCGGKGSVYRRDYDITPLCVESDAAGLSVTRNTEIDFYRMSCNAPAAHVSESFTIYNTGEDTQLSLVYPSLLYAFSDELPTVTMDGQACTDWWGVAGVREIERARAADTLVQSLDDGSYFQRAFPNWPELGEQSHELSSQGSGIYKIYNLSYYVQKVSIPSAGQIVVTVEYDADFAYTVSFLRLNNEIPCTSHTLTISLMEQDTYVVRILDQNLADELPDGYHWTIELSPEKDDYFISVD